MKSCFSAVGRSHLEGGNVVSKVVHRTERAQVLENTIATENHSKKVDEMN